MGGKVLNITAWFAERFRAWLAFVSTALVLFHLLTASHAEDIRWMEEVHGVPVLHLRILYLALLLITGIAWRYEPAIRAELRDGKGTALVLAAAAVISILAGLLLAPEHGSRVFWDSPALLLVVFHLGGLGIVLVSWVIPLRDMVPSRRVARYALVVVVVLGLIIGALHVLSVGRFLPLETTDETFFASTAVTFAETGRVYPGIYHYARYEPISARYTVLPGLWVRLTGDSSLLNLRFVQLMAGALALLITALALWAIPDLNTLQRSAGVVAMLSFTMFLRTSHSLRPDIGLAIYGALALLGLTQYARRQQARWLVLMGLALLIGLESVPMPASFIGVALGAAVIFEARPRPLSGGWRALNWRHIAGYALMCALAYGAYAFIHLAPDFAANWRDYQQVGGGYLSGKTGFRLLQNFVPDITDDLIVTISPLEPILVAMAVFVAAWRAKISRPVALTFVLSIVLLSSVEHFFLSYVAGLVPFAAYLVARAFRTEIMVALGAFVLLPGMVATQSHVLKAHVDHGGALRLMEQTGWVAWHFPEGISVLGEDEFWYQLHPNRSYMNVSGYQRAGQKVDMAICRVGSQCQDIAEAEGFEEVTPFDIEFGQYIVYKAPDR